MKQESDSLKAICKTKSQSELTMESTTPSSRGLNLLYRTQEKPHLKWLSKDAFLGHKGNQESLYSTEWKQRFTI